MQQGAASPTEKLDVNGCPKSTGFKGYGITPIGGVIMWNGSIDAGWKLCAGLSSVYINILISKKNKQSCLTHAPFQTLPQQFTGFVPRETLGSYQTFFN